MAAPDTLSLSAGTQLGLVYLDADDDLVSQIVHCQLLFAGARLWPLSLAYQEIIRRFSEHQDPEELRLALTASSSVAEFYEIGGTQDEPSILLHDEIFREQGDLDGLNLGLRVTRGDRCLERELPLGRFGALGALCSLLRGTHSRHDARSTLAAQLSPADAAWASKLLTDLLRGGFVRAAPRRPGPLTRPRPGPHVTFLGHSSLLFRSARSSVLIDPFLPSAVRDLPRPVFDAPKLDLGAICCSHSHWDHCNLSTLMLFDKRTPVIVPRVDKPTLFNPPIVENLRRLGFTDVREANLWEPIRIDDIEIVPTPFYGEQDEPGAEIDHFTYVVRTPGLSLYGGVDCFNDTYGEMDAVMAEVRRRYAPDIAFLPISKMVYSYRWGGNNSFCRYLDRRLVDQFFEYTGGPEDAAAWTETLQPKVVVPYATFTLQRWATPESVVAFGRALDARGLGDRLHPLRPLDSLDASDLEGPEARLRRRAAMTLFRVGPGRWAKQAEGKLRQVARSALRRG